MLSMLTKKKVQYQQIRLLIFINLCKISLHLPFFSDRSIVAQGSQMLAQDGSSFESASSIYSLARVDAICDDGSLPIQMPILLHPIEDTLPLPLSTLSTKPSPSHSISSSSSGSFRCLPGNSKKPTKPISTSPRPSIVKSQIVTTMKMKTESISDDEKSEKRYSSSGYYESPQDDGN